MSTFFSLFTALSILLLTVTYYYSKPMCFALILPLRACINQMVDVKLVGLFGVHLNPGDIFGMITIALCGLFIISNARHIFLISPVRFLNTCVLSALGWCLLTAVLSYDKFFFLKNWAKMASWMLLLPVSTVLFDQISSVSKLRFWGITSLIVTLTSVGLANALGIGPVAYAGKGMSTGTGFHIGYYASESALSLAITMALPVLFLPRVTRQGASAKLTKLTFTMILLSVVCILFIFLRASILAVFLSFSGFVIMSRKNAVTGLSFLRKIGLIFLMITVIAGYTVTHTEVVKERFHDIVSFQKSRKRETDKLGSGRIWLIKTYLEEWRSRGWAYKLFGVDTGAAGGQRIQYKLTFGAHNDLMTMLYTGGIVAFLLYSLMILQISWMLIRKVSSKSDDVSHHLALTALSAHIIYGVFIVHGALYQILPMSYFAMVVGSGLAYKSGDK